MKILILGHGDHGKDEVAKLIQKFTGLTFTSSSMAAAEKTVFPVLRDKYGYRNVEECFNDRRNHRAEWKQLISDYNTPRKDRLIEEVLKESDMYVGIRCPLEFAAGRHRFDLIVWVDASERKPSDPSMGIKYEPRKMFRVDNNGTKGELYNDIMFFHTCGVFGEVTA